MKRFVVHSVVYLALGVGVLGGCSESLTQQTAAGLSGTYDLTVVGGYVFVTSADQNELRVLDLTASPRDWVRAPNPLESLSIPVLKRPLYLARDVRYDAEGQEVQGPYVYARSAGTQEISVVGAEPTIFRQVKLLEGLGFVTAFAGRGGEGGSVLYYATQDVTGAQLFRRTLPGPEALESEQDPSKLRGERISLQTPLTGETVTALAVLPSPTGVERIAVATRSIAASSTDPQQGRTFELDAVSGAELKEYQFPGPVRLLATHSKVATTGLEEGTCKLDDTTPAKAALAAGEYLFGALDESVCANQEQEACSGIIAVETATGAVALDSTGHPMLPIRVGQALPAGLTLAQNASIRVRCNEESAVQKRPLVGIVPASNGLIHFFDAVSLRPFDLNTPDAADAATPDDVAATGHAVVNINGETKVPEGRTANGYIDLEVREGATRDETYRVLYEGAFQGLSGRPFTDELRRCEGDACSFFVEAANVMPPAGEEAIVRPGDLITLTNEAGACPTALSVISTRSEPPPNGGATRGVLTAGRIPGDCPDPLRFTVRAGPQYPLVVYSDLRGYLGRLAAVDTPADMPFRIPGGYYFHPQGFSDDARFRTASAYLRLSNLNGLTQALTRGDQLIVSARSGYLPFVVGLDTGSLSAGLSSYRLPGPVVHTKVGDSDFAYIAYPSADGILQFSLAGIVDNTANTTGLVPFE
ncbi:hypothetical protein [Hyalangium sp.]|uniref:hypothetical protein n=1 Tax=Hyalangium sp. TaxID=2028555 RepID=UPI002D438769|nr:hypothetical protein [Hyalangium sp.]HYH98112.1 hypothetical protein [Hyalangium sp.]